MTRSDFPWKKLIIRIGLTFILVIATYNPMQFSYFHWFFYKINSLNDFYQSISLFKVFIGLMLITAWIVFLYATTRSLGKWGIFLTIVLYGTFILLFIGNKDLLINYPIIIQWAFIFLISLTVGTGVTWQIIYRWLSGMIEKSNT